jgi:hypothetical protein
MPKPPLEPLGYDYWRRLSPDQMSLGGALTEDYLTLREVIGRLSSDEQRRVSGRVRWEKLYFLKILDLDMSRRDNVYVRRGASWTKWWAACGEQITAAQSVIHEREEIEIDLKELGLT